MDRAQPTEGVADNAKVRTNLIDVQRAPPGGQRRNLSPSTMYWASGTTNGTTSSGFHPNMLSTLSGFYSGKPDEMYGNSFIPNSGLHSNQRRDGNDTGDILRRLLFPKDQ